MRRSVLSMSWVIALIVSGCGSSKNDGVEGMLSGKVTSGGKPVPFVTLVVTGPDGKTSGGSADEMGVYRIPDAPKGMLKFQFVVPGEPGKAAAIPAQYAQPDNGVTFDSKGGTQTFDIKLD